MLNQPAADAAGADPFAVGQYVQYARLKAALAVILICTQPVVTQYLMSFAMCVSNKYLMAKYRWFEKDADDGVIFDRQKGRLKSQTTFCLSAFGQKLLRFK